MTTTLTHAKAKDTTATIHHYGATVTSWIVEGKENLFVSKKAILDGSKAIRGGIPVCFPQFGPWEGGPQHGFARNSSEWTIKDGPAIDSNTGDVKITFCLSDTDATRSQWPNKFEFLYTLTLTTRTLKFDVAITNQESDKEWDFTLCLHTYFRAENVKECSVSGLQGLNYTDKTDGGKEKTEENDLVKITGFTDRVYMNSPDESIIKGLGPGKAIKFQKKNFCDTVVWNPWAENAQKMSDFGDDEYPNMICVEAVQFSTRVALQPGQKYEANQTLSMMD